MKKCSIWILHTKQANTKRLNALPSQTTYQVLEVGSLIPEHRILTTAIDYITPLDWTLSSNPVLSESSILTSFMKPPVTSKTHWRVPFSTPLALTVDAKYFSTCQHTVLLFQCSILCYNTSCYCLVVSYRFLFSSSINFCSPRAI